MSYVLGEVSMGLRHADGKIDEDRLWPIAGADVFEPSVPWRTFRWWHGQKHYSGTYWSSTMRDHVVYESRLELTRLLYADFDQDVTAVFAQPFLLSTTVDDRIRRHVPDFLVLRGKDVPLVVDVKPRRLLTRPKVNFALGWAREVVLSRGWDFEVWCEPPEAELANLRFLAGYRRDWLFDEDLLVEIREADLYGASLGDAFRAFPHHPDWRVRAAVLRLLWCQHFVTDLAVPLSERHELRQAPAAVTGSGKRDLPSPVEDCEQDIDAAEGGTTVHRREPRWGGHVNGSAVRVGVGTRLKYDGEVVTVEEMFGSAAGNEVLVRDGRSCRFRLSLREVLASGRAAVIPDGRGPGSDDPRETASILLAQLTDEELEAVRERAAHINEVLYGFRSGSAECPEPGEPRTPYVATAPKLQRYEAKAAELGVSVRTIKRWVRAFHVDQEAGLVHGGPDRGDGTMGGLGRADPRWVEMALEIMAEHGKDSQPTRAKVIRSVGPRLAARYGEDEVKLPTRATAYRWLEELERRKPTFRLSAKRNRDIAARPPGAYGKLRPTRPGEYLLMDTTRLDVFAMDPVTLKWVQAELTVAMDWYDRCVTGVRVTPVSTQSIDVAAVLFQTYRPRPAGRDWPSWAAWPDHGIPRTAFVERKALEEGEGDEKVSGKKGAAGPALVPETIVVDHGKPFISEHITSVCQRLGLSIQPARLRTGRDKGPIERLFKTLREGLLESLPGYKGPDVFSRGERPEDQAFFFLHELETIIREWVACVYHVRPHDGLVDTRVPGLRLSPSMMFEHGIARAGYIEVPRDPALGFEFLKTQWRPLHHYGVEIRKCRYNGEGLDGYRGETSPYTGPKAKGMWPIHVDPDNINYVYFRRLDTRRWHTLEWEHAPAMKFPISGQAIELARKVAGKKYRFPDDETAVAALLERWHLGLGLTMAERRIALRQAREQSAFDLPDTEGDDIRALPSVARILADEGALGPEDVEDPDADGAEPYEGPVPSDDDEDDELDGRDAADDFYADALEDA
ncbi:TnsA-like heteromeric transposase endonuclease subunit [Streptomyces sp. H39-C1]|uniref:TnsA-like heteromeric transposase endonuclease subunit n=1 Tax=Streptomyces sp. H39-C1 TaxID=3004355 RepID=UPI0022AF26AA|nr:TnsA-like heteromeric transposase endonuclease subunit [Streptomyces sp. H39-C1]MCZ4095253.1 TnsA-like heteromeric transposase endonuclease subunit [Streptomyces sp. H39-C1]